MRGVFLLLAAVAMIPGCAGIRGEPNKPTYQSQEIAHITKTYGRDAFKSFAAARNKRKFRDELIEARLLLIKEHFAEYKRALLTEQSSSRVLVDLAVIGINTAGIFVGAAQIKNILQAVSAAIVGANTKVNEAIFFKNTVIALITKMEELRNQKELEIRRKMQNHGIEGYSLIAAIADINEYFRAGTIHQALFAITKDAGAGAKKAEEETKSLKVTFAEDANSIKLFNWLGWNPTTKKFANEANFKRLQSWMERKGLQARPGWRVVLFLSDKNFRHLWAAAASDLIK